MADIIIHCGACQGTFAFRHPAVQDISRMLTLTIRCPHCQAELQAARDELFMRPIKASTPLLKLVTEESKPDMRKVNRGTVRGL